MCLLFLCPENYLGISNLGILCKIHFICSQHTAPVAFVAGTGVNDELDGSESKAPVRFTVPNQYVPRGIKPSKSTTKEEQPYKVECEVVQSLAKWKRVMLDRLGVDVGEGIYCSSTSIRKGYKGDVTHSIIADQWDYEIRINKSDRNVETLKKYVMIIWKIITDAEGKWQFESYCSTSIYTYLTSLAMQITSLRSILRSFYQDTLLPVLAFDCQSTLRSSPQSSFIACILHLMFMQEKMQR